MAPTNKGKEVVRKGQQKQQAGPSTPKRGKAKPGDANPRDVFILHADNLHDYDRSLAGYLSLDSTSALRDLGRKPSLAVVLERWQEARINAFGVQGKTPKTAQPSGPIFEALMAPNDGWKQFTTFPLPHKDVSSYFRAQWY
ncbi:MAG: hypothetical protein Q9161_008316 [Pseudevernia consocians]